MSKFLEMPLKNNRIQSSNSDSLLLDILLLVFIFSGPILNSFLFIFNLEIGSGQLAIIYVLVTMALFILTLVNLHDKLTIKFILLSISLFIPFVGFLITKEVYILNLGVFNSELLLYLATVPSIILFAINYQWKNIINININLVFIFNILITIICAFVVLDSDNYTGVGLIIDNSGFLYQNISYYAAYCFGMSLFLLNEYRAIEKTKKKLLNKCLYFLLIFQVIIAFFAGGRGGIILTVILFLYYILMIFDFKKFIFGISVLLIFAILLFSQNNLDMNSFGNSSTGLSRGLSIFTGGLHDSGRINFWSLAGQTWVEKPLFGHGIGSVFYLFGSYTHNIFMDVLVEVGLVGFLILALIFIIFFFKSSKLNEVGSLYRFVAMIFLCGLVLNLFSGYFWVNQFLLLPMMMIFSHTRFSDD